MLKRQGDILLELLATDPCLGNRQVIKDGVIARGEATGHAHRVTGGTLVRNYGEMYVLAEAGTEVVHEEHDKLELEPGIWLVHRQREYRDSGDFDPVAD